MAFGIRQGDAASKSWVDATLADLQQKDTLWNIFSQAVEDQEAVQAFAENMPGPDQNVVSTDQDTLSDCT